MRGRCVIRLFGIARAAFILSATLGSIGRFGASQAKCANYRHVTQAHARHRGDWAQQRTKKRENQPRAYNNRAAAQLFDLPQAT
jgi:hypothetical protein